MAVSFAEKTSRNIIPTDLFERKIMFRLKKQAEKDVLQEKRTEPCVMFHDHELAGPCLVPHSKI